MWTYWGLLDDLYVVARVGLGTCIVFLDRRGHSLQIESDYHYHMAGHQLDPSTTSTYDYELFIID